MKPGDIAVDFKAGLLTFDDAVEVRKVPRYRQINALDKGALGDGVTDDKPAIQAAVDELALAGGGTIVLPRSRRGRPYRFANAVTIAQSNVNVVIMAGAHVEKDPTTTAIEPFLFQGTAPAAFDDITADPVAGDVDIVVTTPGNFVVGDWVMIKDDQVRFGGAVKDHWEINRVRAKAGNVLTLEYPLADDYATISTVKPSISTFTPVVSSGIEGQGKITNGSRTDSTIGNAGVRFSFAVAGYCRGLEFEHCQQDAVRYFDSIFGDVSQCWMHDASNFDGSGRGVTVARSTHTLVQGNRLVRLRHGVDISNFSRYILVEGNTLRGCAESGYKTHPDVKWTSFIGNEVDGAYGSGSGSGADWLTTIPAPGFNIDRANKYIVIDNNIIANTRQSGITISTEQTEHVKIRRNVLRKCNITGGTTTGGGIVAVQFSLTATNDLAGYVIEGNELHDMVGRGITCGIRNAIIRGNKIYGGTASGSINAGIFVRNILSSGTPEVVTGVLVEDNYIAGGAGYGIYVGTSDAMVTDVTVRHNRVRDTVNSGIYGIPAQVDDVRCYGNEVINCNTGDSSSHGGIVFGAQAASDVASDNLLIAENKVFACKQRGIMTVVGKAKILGNKVYESVGASAIGIYVPSGASGQVADEIVIDDNTVVGCPGSGIFLADSSALGTVTDALISRNKTMGNGIGIRIRQLSTNATLVGNESLGDTTPFQDDGATTPRIVSHFDLANYRTGFGTTAPSELVHVAGVLRAADLKVDDWARVLKTADETISSDAVLSDDAALTFPVAANTKYLFRFEVFFDTSAAADFQCDVNGPAAPTLVRMRRQAIRPGETAYAGLGVWTAFAQTLTLAGAGTTGGSVIVEGILQNGANAGNVTFRWAQATSDASNTTVLGGSSVEWWRL